MTYGQRKAELARDMENVKQEIAASLGPWAFLFRAYMWISGFLFRLREGCDGA